MKTAFLRFAMLVLLISAVAGLSACGKASETQSKAGPSDATVSGYTFTMAISPNVVKTGGSCTITVRVTNATGVAVASVSVAYSGDASSGTATTDANGVAQASLTTTGGAGSTGWITATVQDKSLTIPYQIKP